VVEEALERIAGANGALRAFCEVRPAAARAAAAVVDARVAEGADPGPLAGVPVAVKDVVWEAGVEATDGSRALLGFVPEQSAAVVRRLVDAGAVVVGRTNVPEFCYRGFCTNDLYGTTSNPWDLGRTPGGSSGGAATAVAAGLVPLAIGTDGGGSIRIPSSFCGVTGIKPSFGTVPREPQWPGWLTLTHLGPIAFTVQDCALMLSVMAGHDPRDPAARRDQAGPPGTRPDYAGALTGDLSGLRIGVERTIPAAADWCDPALLPALDDVADGLAAAGADVTEVEIPCYRALADADLVIMAGEAFSFHRTAMTERWSDYGRYTRTFIAQGALLSAADYVTAQRARRVACAALGEVLGGLDAIVTPTCAAGAPAYQGLDMGSLMTQIFTGAFNSTGLPALALPAGFTAAGMPLSVQVIGHPRADATVLAIGDALQRRTAHHLAEPEIASHG
jgi:aspartyl-tRNA(Asn)/glutamyl-tRNA(Gln) amidotransferase subunit A